MTLADMAQVAAIVTGFGAAIFAWRSATTTPSILKKMPVGEDGDQVFQVGPNMFIHHRLTFISRLNKWSAA